MSDAPGTDTALSVAFRADTPEATAQMVSEYLLSEPGRGDFESAGHVTVRLYISLMKWISTGNVAALKTFSERTLADAQTYRTMIIDRHDLSIEEVNGFEAVALVRFADTLVRNGITYEIALFAPDKALQRKAVMKLSMSDRPWTVGDFAREVGSTGEETATLIASLESEGYIWKDPSKENVLRYGLSPAGWHNVRILQKMKFAI